MGVRVQGSIVSSAYRDMSAAPPSEEALQAKAGALKSAAPRETQVHALDEGTKDNYKKIWDENHPDLDAIATKAGDDAEKLKAAAPASFDEYWAGVHNCKYH